MIATVAALTLAIRVIGGSIGYCVYYNIFVNKFIPNVTYQVGYAMEVVAGSTSLEEITNAVLLTSASLTDELSSLPSIGNNTMKLEAVIAAGQLAFAESYQYVYYTSIAFGAISIIASIFLEDISKFMDDHVAVVIS